MQLTIEEVLQAGAVAYLYKEELTDSLLASTLQYIVQNKSYTQQLNQIQKKIEYLLYQYSSLYDFSPIAYFTLDVYAKILEVNLTACQLVDIPKDNLIHSSFMVLIENEPQFLHFQERVSYTQKDQCMEIMLKRSDLMLIECEIKGVSQFILNEEDKHIPCLRLAVTNISHVKQIESALDEQNMQLHQAVQLTQKIQNLKLNKISSDNHPATSKHILKTTHKARILLVDDDLTSQMIIATLLEAMECKVDVLDNGEAALNKVKENTSYYDLVLMEIHLPEMNGLESTRQIRMECIGFEIM